MELEHTTGIVVTSYEDDTPILTHIFWGEDIDEALGNAKAHMVTDFFFSSSFRGRMRWSNGSLHLKVSVYGIGDASSENMKDIYETLDMKASEINNQQIQYGYEDILLKLSKRIKL